MKLRVKFSKHGNIRYIGHLDVMRYFQKANRRAGIDIKYSGGYSPHQIMSFAQPLSVGFESDGEYMDIEVGQIESTDQVKEALNSVMAEGIHIEEVKVLPSDAKNAMASIAAASYYVRFKDGFCPAHDTLATIEAFMAQESIPYIKKICKRDPFKDDKKIIAVICGEPGHGKTSLCQKAMCDFYKNGWLATRVSNVFCFSCAFDQS